MAEIVTVLFSCLVSVLRQSIHWINVPDLHTLLLHDWLSIVGQLCIVVYGWFDGRDVVEGLFKLKNLLLFIFGKVSLIEVSERGLELGCAETCGPWPKNMNYVIWVPRVGHIRLEVLHRRIVDVKWRRLPTLLPSQLLSRPCMTLPQIHCPLHVTVISRVLS
jgi:hypothetical protein